MTIREVKSSSHCITSRVHDYNIRVTTGTGDVNFSHVVKTVSARSLHLPFSVRSESPRPACTPGSTLKRHFLQGGMLRNFWTCVKITTELIDNFEVIQMSSFLLKLLPMNFSICQWILPISNSNCVVVVISCSSHFSYIN